MTYRILQRSRLIILILSFIHFFLSIILLFLPAFSHPVFLTDDLLRTFLRAFSTVRTFLRINMRHIICHSYRVKLTDSFTHLTSDTADRTYAHHVFSLVERAALYKMLLIIRYKFNQMSCLLYTSDAADE